MVVEYLMKYISITKDECWAFEMLGLCHLKLGKYNNAIEYFQKSLDLDSDRWKSMEGLGDSYFELKEYDKAIDCYQKAVNRDLDREIACEIYSSLAWCYYEKEDYEQAIEYFQKSRTYYSDYSRSIIGLGYCCFQLGRYKKSIEYLEEALSKYPNEDSIVAEILDYLGWCYKYLKDLNKALDHFKKGIQHNPDDATLYNSLGTLYRDDLKDYDKAYEYFVKAIEVSNEKDDEILFDFSFCLYKMKRYEEERQILYKVLKINPNNELAWHNLGCNYYRARSYSKAIHCYRERIKLDDESRDSIYSLAEVYEKIGDIANAIATWKLYVKNGSLLPKAVRKIGELRKLLDGKHEGELKYNAPHKENIVGQDQQDSADQISDRIDYLLKDNSDKMDNLITYKSEGAFKLSRESMLEEEITRLIENGMLFEGELKIFVDTAGVPGRQYRTDVGIVDLLCHNIKNNNLVVIELKRGSSSDKVVGQISRYIGYIKKNIAQKGQRVEGIIIVFKRDKRLEYAVAAHENIKVMTYRAQIKLE